MIEQQTNRPRATVHSPLEQAMAKLEERRIAYQGDSRSRRVPLSAIKSHPDVFDVRGHDLDDYHADQLAKILATKDDLPPILILPVGNGFVLVDGHHRLEAYRQNERKDIPAEVFMGTVREALLLAVERNSEQKVALVNSQRQDCAWRFVLAAYTIPQIVRATGISRTQVGNMRRAMKSLGEDAVEHVQWWRARNAAEGKEELQVMTDDEHAAWLQGKVDALAGVVKRATGPVSHENPELFGRAIALATGRKAPEVARWIMASLTEGAQAQLDRDEALDW